MAQHRPHTERPLYKMSVQLIDTYKLINKVSKRRPRDLNRAYQDTSPARGPPERPVAPL